MTLRLGDLAPDFNVNTTQGLIDFHSWKADSWAVLFSHPKDFTPVCTTELGYAAGLAEQFAAAQTSWSDERQVTERQAKCSRGELHVTERSA